MIFVFSLLSFFSKLEVIPVAGNLARSVTRNAIPSASPNWRLVGLRFQVPRFWSPNISKLVKSVMPARAPKPRRRQRSVACRNRKCVKLTEI